MRLAPAHPSRVPHVTLARLSRRGFLDPHDPWVTQQNKAVYGPLEGAGMVLFESVLSSQGSRYIPLTKMAFGEMSALK